jgi:hypothetical protein
LLRSSASDRQSTAHLRRFGNNKYRRDRKPEFKPNETPKDFPKWGRQRRNFGSNSFVSSCKMFCHFLTPCGISLSQPKKVTVLLPSVELSEISCAFANGEWWEPATYKVKPRRVAASEAGKRASFQIRGEENLKKSIDILLCVPLKDAPSPPSHMVRQGELTTGKNKKSGKNRKKC